MRYPLLEMMRAKRLQREAEIAAPYVAEASRARQTAQLERDARQGLERAMSSKLAPMIFDRMAADIASELEHAILKAVVSAAKFAPETTITVPTGMLMHADRNSVVSRVVDWWKMETAPKISFRAVRGDMEIQSSVTTIEVRVPELRCRHAFADHF